MVAFTPASKQAQTNSAGATLKDRNSTGPRPDGGAGGELPTFEGWVPVGGIIMYSGSFDDIPANWHLCDGTEGTPDLTDRFVLGTNTALELEDVGGSDTHKHNAGTLAVGSHTTASDTAVAGAATRVTTATHAISGATEDTVTLPPWLKLAFIQRIE